MATLRNDIKTFDFDDVRLLPSRCIVKSRSEINTSVTLGHHVFNLPVIPANMSTIIDENFAEWLATNGYFYVMHRFGVDSIAFTKRMQSKGLVSSISLGIKQDDYDTISCFVAEEIEPEFITIDVAHGDSNEVIRMLKAVRVALPNSYTIVGNVATVDAALSLVDAGAHAIKVGVGPGMACTTAPNTGFGTRGWQLSAVEQVANSVKGRADVIADGGIREYGDIAKAIALGADLVMIGGMLAGHDENPGEVIVNENGETVKAFFGSASEHQKGEVKHVEGRKLYLPYKGSITETFRTIKENLQSSISYAGGKNLLYLRDVEYVILNNR